MPNSNTFDFVYIPANSSEPIEEWQESFDPNDDESPIKALTNRCKKHFTRVRGPRTPEQQQARKAALLQNVSPDMKVDDAMLDTATAMSMVEHTNLLSNSKDNDFVGINLYTDDEASFSGAGINQRASEIAGCCGIALQVNGDAFLSRTYDNGDDFKRLNFNLAEVSSSAPWVKEAKAQNDRKRRNDTPSALKSRLQPPPQPQRNVDTPAHTDQTPAETAKLKGNAALKNGDLHEAVKLYSEALELDGAMASAYNNRALAHLKLNNLADAEADCGYVLRLEPHNAKALLRRGSARAAMQRHAEAIEDFKQVLLLQPANKDAQAKLHAAEQQMTSA